MLSFQRTGKGEDEGSWNVSMEFKYRILGEVTDEREEGGGE